jgi:hypothetical protein
MARGWWAPQHPPGWVLYMARAARNRAMRDLLRPPLPAVRIAPLPSGQAGPVVTVVKDLTPARNAAQRIWLRFVTMLSRRQR